MSEVDPTVPLAPGSLVVSVGRDAPAWGTADDEGVTSVVVDDDAAADPAGVVEMLQRRFLGKVVSRPEVHLLIDVLRVGQDSPSPLLETLLGFMHPAGLVVATTADDRLGTPANAAGMVIHRGTRPARDIPFAKLSAEERDWLHTTVAALAPGSLYVEVGSYKGGSAVLAAQANPGIRIYAVDIWQRPPDPENPAELFGDLGVFRRNTQFLPSVTGVQVELEHAEDAPRLIAEHERRAPEDLQVDFMFIDGDHSFRGVTRDLEIYAPHTTGLLTGHDYGHLPETRRAVDLYFANPLRAALIRRLSPKVWHTPLGRLLRPPIVRTFPGRNSIWAVDQRAGA